MSRKNRHLHLGLQVVGMMIARRRRVGAGNRIVTKQPAISSKLQPCHSPQACKPLVPAAPGQLKTVVRATPFFERQHLKNRQWISGELSPEVHMDALARAEESSTKIRAKANRITSGAKATDSAEEPGPWLEPTDGAIKNHTRGISDYSLKRGKPWAFLRRGGRGGIRGPQKIPIFWGADNPFLAQQKGVPTLAKNLAGTNW